MLQTPLTAFIAEYIAARGQTRLEAFDKAAAKRLEADGAATIAAERRGLELRYTPGTWLTDAAARAGQISLVTHAAKFTHGDSKGSSLYSETRQDDGYLGSAALDVLATDAVGNAAALDVAKLLQTEVEGDSLLAALKRQDHSALATFAENEQQLAQWVAGFSRALTPGQPASHKLAKQIYFPVNGGYHLLSPLFASSLTHAMHQKIVALRFGDEAKAAWQARRSETWHHKPLVSFPQMAEMHFGGTKPQNISYLNSVRGGRAWLLAAQPPRWKAQDKPPRAMRSLFTQGAQYDRAASPIIRRITRLVIDSGDYKNVHIRQARDGYIDELIDRLFVMAANYQREEWQGWSQHCPELKMHQQLWLDPWRCKIDDAFAAERDKDEWQDLVAEDFARWLNHRLRKQLPDVGQAEKRSWETRLRLRQQLREMEQIIREGLK
ncbi:type I-F CRISPR-associated protein Csy1 [Enterobacteriaceae bacterium BIT-l23]|uniref:type I-F CRISPR-associated protein Csy1 n=1 Tax=Jejubacter sp. L23 TaxID=3092086 RepID=UPI0015847C97|nr:type I-F CRISPR-associated protein Csy1 [Enterobacteriaceae bacterium BIT-l23]